MSMKQAHKIARELKEKTGKPYQDCLKQACQQLWGEAKNNKLPKCQIWVDDKRISKKSYVEQHDVTLAQLNRYIRKLYKYLCDSESDTMVFCEDNVKYVF